MKDEDKSKEQLMEDLTQLRNLMKDKGIDPEEAQKNDLEKIPAEGKKILLVDDNEDLRRFAAIVLRKNGYIVLESSESINALKQCKECEGSLHLILSDIVLPGESGIELVKKVRSVKPEIKVVFMSGYTDEVLAHPDVLQALNENEEFLKKPFTRAELLEKIETILKR